MFFIYKSLAHPEASGYVSPYSLDERLMHIREAKRTLGTTIPWLADGMANDIKHALGDAPNSEFIIGPDGKVLVLRQWSKPEDLRRDLEKLVGPVDTITRVSDLEMKTQPPPKVAPQGIVPRLKLPGNLRALKVEPVVEASPRAKPFYAKLRAEGDTGATGGKGRVYLGFHLDPIYHVHWNNLVAPLSFEITDMHQVKVNPASGKAPQPSEPADIDPREFLLDVESKGRDARFTVKVTYFGCNDEEGWCVRIQQSYVVHLQVDPDGGRARRSGMGRPGGGRPAQAGNRGFNRFPGGPPGGGQMGGGRLSTVDAEKRVVTVRTRQDGLKSYTVSEQARMIRNGRPAKLSDFKPEDMVRLRVSEGEGDNPKPLVIGLMGRSLR